MSIINSIKQLFNKETTNEGAGEPTELLKVTLPDIDLIKVIDNNIREGMPLYQAIAKVQDENDNYYLGEQLDKKRFKWELPTAENLLYMAVETIISVITAKRRNPIVMPSRNEDDSKDLAEKTGQFLSWKWNAENMLIKFEDWVRHAMLYRIGVFKLRFDIETDDFEIQVIRPKRIMVDKDATDEYNAKFIVEFKEDTLDDLIKLFPGAKDKLTQEFGTKMGTKVKYLEYWTNEFVVWKVNNIVLDKKKNPNWNWDETDRQGSLKKLRDRWIDKTKNEKLENILLNFFNEPRKPYVIISLKNLGKDIYGDTNDFDQAKVIQDIVNRRKRQIDKAAVRALGREVFSGSYISKEEAKKSAANPNAAVWLKNGKASDAVTHIAPQPISPVVFNDLQESKTALDNIMGTHGTTRGEQGAQETARGRTLLKEGDYGRIDLMARRIDKKLELLYGWMMQMAKVYYNEQHLMKIMGSEGANNYLKFSSDDIEDGQEVIVKSELTVDKATERENANRKLEAGLQDPLSYFEAFDTPNPKELARRLVFYNTDPKLYVQQFCTDENTDGAETTSKGKAEQEQKQLMAGEQVPPFENADKLHIDTHAEFIKGSEFQQLEDVEIKQNTQSHIQQEIDLLKQQTQI